QPIELYSPRDEVVQALAVDRNNVYFADSQYRYVPLTGGDPITLATVDSYVSLVSLAADGASLYAAVGRGLSPDCGVLSLPLSGGVTRLYDDSAIGTDSANLLLVGGVLAWEEYGLNVDDVSIGTVATSTGTPMILPSNVALEGLVAD